MPVLDAGPFYHGTRADLEVGSLLTAGRPSNYDARVLMRHVYFSADAKIAGLAAELAQGEGRQRVYVVEPTGDFEDDPNVTDRKFPGNPTRSYRSAAPLKVVGELDAWERFDPAYLQNLRALVASGRGAIIN